MLIRLVIFLGAGLLAGAGSPAWAQYTWDWAGSTSGDSHTRPTASAVDAGGHLVVSGYVSSTTPGSAIQFGNGVTVPAIRQGAFLARYAPTGACQWATTIDQAGATGAPQVVRIATDPLGNVFVGGICRDSTYFGPLLLRHLDAAGQPWYDEQGFVGKLTAAGQWQWVKSIGSSSNPGARLEALVADSAGNVYVGGSFYDFVRADSLLLAGGAPLFVGKLDGVGQWQWLRNPASTVSDANCTISAMQVDRTGDLYLAGSLDTVAIFGSDTLTGPSWWQGTGPVVPLVMDPFVARISAAGQWQFARPLPVSDPSILMPTPGGGMMLAGHAGPGTYTATVGPQGQVSAPTLLPAAERLTLGPDGTLYLVGRQRDSLQFGPYRLAANPDRAFYVAARQPSGQWAGVAEATTRPYAGSLGYAATYPEQLVATADHLYLAGRHAGIATFGTTVLTSPTTWSNLADDFFVARLAIRPLGLRAAREAADVQLWPNPAHGRVRISTPGGGTVEVVDGLGRIVRVARSEFRVASGEYRDSSVEVDLRGVPAGVYVVRCGGMARKLVVD